MVVSCLLTGITMLLQLSQCALFISQVYFIYFYLFIYFINAHADRLYMYVFFCLIQ